MIIFISNVYQVLVGAALRGTVLERFPDGVYRDVVGLCKVASLKGEDGIEEQDYSLNAGRYVGVVIEDDGMTEDEFKLEMQNLLSKFEALNTEASIAANSISAKFKELGL